MCDDVDCIKLMMWMCDDVDCIKLTQNGVQ